LSAFFVPIEAPGRISLLATRGFDPICFGIALVMMIEGRLTTLPVGIIMFVLRELSAEGDRFGVLPFAAIILANDRTDRRFPEIVGGLLNRMEQ
jgi:TRAP-type C4-dicarboxylate transport system permease large subunit